MGSVKKMISHRITRIIPWITTSRFVIILWRLLARSETIATILSSIWAWRMRAYYERRALPARLLACMPSVRHTQPRQYVLIPHLLNRTVSGFMVISRALVVQTCSQSSSAEWCSMMRYIDPPARQGCGIWIDTSVCYITASSVLAATSWLRCRLLWQYHVRRSSSSDLFARETEPATAIQPRLGFGQLEW